MHAEESDSQAIGLFTGEQEQVATTSHYPRPLSKIAENVTVITAEQIERLNAHTLAEVLQTVPGIQLDQVRTPGSSSFFSIHNNNSRFVQVLIDGVPQNFLSADNLTLLGTIPVQQIERVEIIKGAASVAWGQALGGVVNVITKSPTSERAVGGMGSASVGEKLTSDLRGELSGTIDRFGYYLTGGNLHSDGLMPGNRVNFNHALGKITYDLPSKGGFTLGFDYRDSDFGLEDVPDKPFPDDFHDTGGFRNTSGFLNFGYPLADRLSLEVLGRVGRRELLTTFGNLSIPDLFQDSKGREDFRGLNLNLFWGDKEANLTTGFVYDHTDISQREPIQQNPLGNFDMTLDSWGVFLNGAYTFGPLTVLPGLRHDNTNLYGGTTSYNLGATYQLTDQTLLRAYAAKGYSLPVVNTFAISNGSKRLQKIWTVQTGFETTAIPFLWLKGTYFYSELRDIENFTFPDTPGSPAVVNLKSQRKQVVEIEGRTTPLYGFTLAGGYTFTDARDLGTGDELPTDAGQSNPPQGLKLAVNYTNSPLGLLGALTGNYVWWNATADRNAHYKAMIWDLHLTQKLFPSKELSPELFFSAHNLFNGTQYQQSLFKNTPRWVEGGVRFRF